MVRPLLQCAVAAGILLTSLGAEQSAQQAQQPQQPVFRAGVNLVQVDAYPTGPDGKIIEGLSASDFELSEDGKPQQIESSEFIRVDLNTAIEERRDPNTQADGNKLAADPRNRVFVVFLDRYHNSLYGGNAVQRPLVDMLNRMIAPTDLFGVATVLTRPRDLVFGRRTETLEDQLTRHWTWGLASGVIDLEPEEQHLHRCYGEGMALRVAARTREERTLDAIDSLITYLGALREARKVFIVFSRGWPLFRPEPGQADAFLRQSDGQIPRVGISTTGTLTTTPAVAPGMADWTKCSTELKRAFGLDNHKKFRDLIEHANRQNVTFYPVNPNGLTGGVNDVLQSLANETDGFTSFTNDMRAHLKRIADDVSAYYVLGYYSNAKPDGAFHKIAVKVKRPDANVKARRGFVSPLVNEGATAAAVAPRSDMPEGFTAAAGVLSRLRPSADLFVSALVSGSDVNVVVEVASALVTREGFSKGADVQVTVTDSAGSTTEGKARIDAGTRGVALRLPKPAGAGPYRVSARILAGGDEFSERVEAAVAAPSVLGAAALFRASPAAASPLRPVADMQFRRTERAHVEWPVSVPLGRREARLLAKDGKALPVPVTVTESETNGRKVVAADLSLAPLAVGDYVIELAVESAGKSERAFVAIRIRQ